MSHIIYLTQIQIAFGALQQLKTECEKAHILKPLIVTDAGVKAAGLLDMALEVLGPDTVVCILEAMKVMNEIKAETSGVITEILAENGKPVQYGQALFRIR